MASAEHTWASKNMSHFSLWSTRGSTTLLLNVAMNLFTANQRLKPNAASKKQSAERCNSLPSSTGVFFRFLSPEPAPDNWMSEATADEEFAAIAPRLDLTWAGEAIAGAALPTVVVGSRQQACGQAGEGGVLESP